MTKEMLSGKGAEQMTEANKGISKMKKANNEFSGKKEKDSAPIRFTCKNCVHFYKNDEPSVCGVSYAEVSGDHCTCELFTPRRSARLLRSYKVIHATEETPEAALDSLSRRLMIRYSGGSVVPIGGATLLKYHNAFDSEKWIAYQTLEAVSERAGK